MKYTVKLTERAAVGIERFRMSGDKSSLKKIDALLEELVLHPRTGTGHPEQLKGYENRWSRRITQKHRLVYEIEEDVVVVLVISLYGHYDDR